MSFGEFDACWRTVPAGARRAEAAESANVAISRQFREKLGMLS